jgi:hypothetical protein
MELSIEQIQSKWQTLNKLAENTGTRRDAIVGMLDSLGERYLMAPASAASHLPGCYSGGLLDTTLSVIKKMRSLAKALELDVSNESIIVVGICHSLGLLGGPENGQDYLVPQDSDWHLKQGKRYKFGESVVKMPISHRSLYLAQHFGIHLSHDEWQAIAVSGGQSREENRFYIGSESTISILLMQARQWVFGDGNS